MDMIIDKISEIEAFAVSIMEEASAVKKAFFEEMNERTDAFDRKLEEDTKKQILSLRAKMESDLSGKLASQKADTERTLKLLEERYQQYHQSYSEKLFKKMTEE